MTNTNMFVEIGNATRDVGENDYTTLANGNGLLNFSIAVNRSKKQGEQWVDEVSYLNFTCFGKLADNMKNFIKKGTKVCVTGYIKQDRWEKDGKKYSELKLIAENIELLSRKEGSSENSTPGSYSQSVNAAQKNQQTNDDEFPEDIPF